MTRNIENLFEKLFEIKEETTEDKCPDCENFLVRKYQIGFGPFNGRIECECGYRDTLYGHIGKNCVKVEPLDDTDERE